MRTYRVGRATGSVALVERKRGAQWYLHYRLTDGRQVQRRLGPAWTGRGRPTSGHFTKRMAEDELRRRLTDAERGTPAGTRRTEATFGDACAEWLRYVEHDRLRRPSTVSDYRNLVRGSLLPAFGAETALEVIDQDRIDAFRAQLVTEGRLSPRTVNKLLVALHAVFKRAQRAYRLPVNPVAGVERQPMRRSGDFSVLGPGEVQLLAQTASATDGPLFVVAAFTGLRMGELRALRWRDVDFAKRLVHVRRSVTRSIEGAPKSGRVRSVPLIDQAARAFDELSRREHFNHADDFVFINEVGGPVHDGALRQRFYTALAAAGLERLRFHDLRHTFGTLAVQAFPLSDVRAYMGHADIATTMIYVHHVPQHDAADRLGRVVADAQDQVGPDAGQRRVTKRVTK